MKQSALLAVGLLLAQAVTSPLAAAGSVQGQPSGTVTGFVIPNQVGANEAFTFAATGVVEGTVVSVQTADGKDVKSMTTDKLGRVYMAGGLLAGAYLLTVGGGKGSSKLNVGPARALPSGGSLSIPDLPGCFDAKQGLALSGEGMSAKAADMSVKIGKTEFPVLAGTATEMKTGPLPSSACGVNPVEIKNAQTGDTSTLDNVLCYELSAKLSKQTIAGGEQTYLEFTFNPANFTANVIANILSGPISFRGGAKERDIQIKNGSGKLPLVADPAGTGQFQVVYNIHEILGAGPLDGSVLTPLKPGGVGKEKPEPAGNQKPERCPLTKHIRDEANGWDTSEKKVKDPETGKERTIYICSRTVRCNIHKSCSKTKGHGGACTFTGKSRCQDHDITETREFATEQERKDSMKETAIPAKIKYP